MCEKQDIVQRRARDLERYHRRTAERKAQGLCLRCGKRPPAPHRSQCKVCTAKCRHADLERYHRRTAERVAQGLCPRCGARPPAPDRSVCEPCNEKTNRASRSRYARLRAEGKPRRNMDRAREYERERSRKERAVRLAEGTCTRCGLCGTPHNPHDVDSTVMLSSAAVSFLSKGLMANHFT